MLDLFDIFTTGRRLPPHGYCLPVAFASGYADTKALEQVLGKGAPILRKPFRREALARFIAALLARRATDRAGMNLR